MRYNINIQDKFKSISHDKGCGNMRFTSNSPDDTEKVGFCLGSIVKKGYVVCLIGDLGAGKTEFVKGFARGVGVEDYITSPTFTIINEYRGRLPLYHFDVYRLDGTDDMQDIGYEEYFYGDGVSVIEWADLIMDIIPHENIIVSISKDLEEGENFREIIIEFSGETYEGLISDIIQAWEL